MRAGLGTPDLGPVRGLLSDLHGAPLVRAMVRCRGVGIVPVPGAGQVLRPKPSRRPSR